MAEAKTDKIEREYIIPLRRKWMHVACYRRTGKAIKAIKEFIAHHMKVPDRNLNKVKLDVYFNNDFWFRGMKHPPAKIKVKAVKEGDIVKVGFVEIPQHVKFLIKKHKVTHQKSEKKVEVKEEVKEEKIEEKKVEIEKEKAVEAQNVREARLELKENKHLTSIKEPKINRMALKK